MTDTELNELLNKAERQRSTDPTAAIKIALEAISAARAVKDLAAQTRAYYILSTVFLGNDDQRKAITYAGLSIRFAKDYGHTDYLAGSYIARGTAGIRNFEIERGIKDLIFSLEELNRVPNFETEGYAWRVITSQFRGLKRFEFGLQAAELCVHAYNQVEGAVYQLAGYLTKLNCLAEKAIWETYHSPEKLPSTLQLLTQTLENIDFNLPNSVLIQEAYSCQGDYFMASKQFEKAVQSYDHAILLAEKTEMKVARSFAAARRALAFAEAEDLEKATEAFQQASQWRKVGQDRFDDLEITETLYRCAKKIKDPAFELLRNQMIANEKRKKQGLEVASVRLRVLEDLIIRKSKGAKLESA